MKFSPSTRRSSAWLRAPISTALLALYAPSVIAGEAVTPPWVNQLGAGLSGLFGQWISAEIVAGVRWMTLIAAGLVILVVAVAHAVLRWLVHLKIRQNERKAEAAPVEERETFHWVHRTLHAAIPPLALMIWIYGVYAALSLVLLDLEFRNAAMTVLAGLRIARAVAFLGALFWLLYRIGDVLDLRLRTLSIGTASAWDRVIFPLAGRTLRVVLPLLALILGLPALPVSPDIQALIQRALSLLLIGGVALVLAQMVQATERFVLFHYRVDVADNLHARKVRTQVTVLKKIALVVIAIFTLASMLMVFDSVRRFGTSILASAGVAGIIIGFAAQRTIGTLLAGFQIAITQPIRIDDVVIVENEWGRVEDITLTYVVVRIWDLRRLIVPMTYFIEKPVQNWTVSSANLLGTVFLYVDYTMPVEPLRKELDRICENSPYWDRQYKGLLVTDAKERTIEVRALASGADADNTWNLRCEIREKLIEFVRKNYPQSLPRVRAELEPLRGQSVEHARPALEEQRANVQVSQRRGARG